MTYVPTVWVDHNPPCINAANLNHIEYGIYHGLAHSGGIRNVAQFAAENPGSTTAGIQEAIDDLPATGGIIFIPAGEYVIDPTSTITIDIDNVSLVGAGMATTELRANADSVEPIIEISGAARLDKVNLQDFTIQSPSSADRMARPGVFAHRVTCLTITNVEIYALDECAFEGEGLWDANIVNLKVHWCGNEVTNVPGVQIGDDAVDKTSWVAFFGSTFERCWYEAVHLDTAFGTADNIVFTGCKFHGLLVTDDADEYDLVYVDGMYGTRFVNCDFRATRKRALIVDGDAYGTMAVGCSLQGDVTNLDEFAIVLVDGHFSTISGCEFAGFVTGAIDVQAASSNNTIGPNSYRSCGATIIQDNGSYATILPGYGYQYLKTYGGLTHVGKVSVGVPTTLIIAAGVITVTRSNHIVDTEGAAAADDLDTIAGGIEGMQLTLRTANFARDVTLKDGTGNLALAGDFTLGDIRDIIILVWAVSTGKWCEMSRSTNG